MRVRLHRATPATAAARGERSALEWEAPRLPAGAAPGPPRRLTGPTWTAPGRSVLVRHRALDARRWVLSVDRQPPPGHVLEYDLGQVHVHALPGTSRLLARGDEIRTTRAAGTPAAGWTDLGHVEDAPLPLLEALHLARVRDTGQVTLVSGPADPLLGEVELLDRIGFVDGYPLEPRVAHDVRGADWGAATLVRIAERDAWRHVYAAVRGDLPAGAVVLGAVWVREPVAGMVALRVEADGRVTSDLLQARTPMRTPVATARWVGAPLGWTGSRPKLWAARAAASRARAVGTGATSRHPPTPARVLGHLHDRPAPDRTPLFSARHPAVADQLLTRSDLEARDLGYVVEGVVGYVGRGAGHSSLEQLPREVRWGSRFGHGRRYVEPPGPDEEQVT